MSTKRVLFTDTSTGKPYYCDKPYPAEIAVLYFGKRIGTMTRQGESGSHNDHVYRFNEVYPGSYTRLGWIWSMRTYIRRYFDAKYAKLGVANE